MTSRWSPFVKQLVIIGIFAVLIWLLSRLWVLLGPIVLALLLAYLVSLPVGWIERRTGWDRTPVAVITYVIVFVLIVTAPVIIVPRLVSLLASFAMTLARVVRELAEATPKPISVTPSLSIDLGPYYAPVSQLLQGMLGQDLGNFQAWRTLLSPFATGAAVVVRGAVSTIVSLILVVAVSFYVLKDGPRLGRFIATRLPEPMRPELRRLGAELVPIWDSFVRGQLLLGLAMGTIVWIATSILGFRNAPAFGLLSGLMEFLPGVGPVVAAIPAILIALILGSTWLPLPHIWFAALTALTYFLLSQFENLFLLPRIVGRRISLYPAVVIVGALAGARLGGVLGILLAAPTIASARVLFGYIIHKLLDQPPFPEPEAPIDRKLYWDELIQERCIRAVLFDLDGTLMETDDGLVSEMVGRLGFLNRVIRSADLEHAVRRGLMMAESPINGLITWLNWLRLDGLLFRIGGFLRRCRGFRAPEDYVAVDGSVPAIQKLGQRYLLALVTSRSHADVESFLEQYHLAGAVPAVITRDDVRQLKPHPAPVRAAAKRLGVDPKQCVMVGDTGLDVRAAKAAGALAVGVLSGFGEPRDLQGADLIIDTAAELGEWL